MEANLFWLCAVVQLLASLKLVVLIKRLEGPQVTAKVRQLASGQRKDSWLAAAIIWGLMLGKQLPYLEVLLIAGSLCLVWLIVRSCQGIVLVVRERAQ